jgi:hypothetical protein
MKLHVSLLALPLSLFVLAQKAEAATTFVTGSGTGTGNERCVTGAAQNGGICNAVGSYSALTSIAQLFADSQGLTLTRVDDSLDQHWITTSGNAGVFAVGRSAARDFSLGVIPISGSYADVRPAIVGNQVDLPAIPPGQNGNGDIVVAGYSAGIPIFTSFAQAGVFAFALKQTSGAGCVAGVCPDLWSSIEANNSEAGGAGTVHLDHMVTWQLSGSYLTTNGLAWYVAGFENAGGTGSDRDFNDYVFVFQDVAPAVPEPGTWIVGLGLVALGLMRKRTPRKP